MQRLLTKAYNDARLVYVKEEATKKAEMMDEDEDVDQLASEPEEEEHDLSLKSWIDDDVDDEY
jgi:hypothetical protein